MKNLLFILSAVLIVASCKQQLPEQINEQAWSKSITSFVNEEDIDTVMTAPMDTIPTEYEAFLAEIYKDIFSGKLQAYDYKSGDPLSADEVKKSLIAIDSMQVPFAKDKIIVTTDYEKQTYSTKVKEVWRYNKSTKVLEKRVTALAPCISVYSSSTGIGKKVTPFWVFFDTQAEEEFKKSFKTINDSIK